MNIGINALTRFSGGALVHLKNVLKYWAAHDRKNEYYIFTTAQNVHRLNKVQNENFHYRLFKFPALSLFTRLFWEQMIFPHHLKKTGIDILYCPSNFGPVDLSLKTVLMIQNIAPFCDEITAQESFYQKTRMQVLSYLIGRSIHKASAIIFPSQYSQRLLSNKFSIDDKKTYVIYHGRNQLKDEVTGDDNRFKTIMDELSIEPNFILCVTSIRRYKNIINLIKAYKKVQANIKDIPPLVMVGRILDNDYLSEISSVIKSYKLVDKIKFLGEIEHEKLLHLYSHCLFFVSSSTCEIFSLILLEAMSSGAPIICSNTTAMPEICNKAAIFFDPYCIDDIAEKIEVLIKNETLRKELKQKALQRAKDFPTWQDVAKKTLTVFEEIHCKS